jgi:ATP-dependent DNA helicase DinG
MAAGRLDVLRRLAAPGDDDVVWIERVGRNRRLRIAPVDAGETIGRFLLTQRPVIGVSATLGGEPPFAALARGMGFRTDDAPGRWGERDDDGRWTSNAGRGYVAIQTSSSFDWRMQGMLYVAKDLPDPGRARDAWMEGAGDRLCELVNAAGGRSLVLCTSHANVRHFAEVLRTRTDHDVLAQGERDAGRLTRDFLEDETSVLVGTRSFWAGIDAIGAACVLVAIDKIPFPAPDEPLHAARRTRAERRGVDPFVSVDLPVAALVLAQGAGRLIRTVTDRGVVAVLDARLATRPYRRLLLAAMPPLRRSIDLAETCAFLEEVAATSPARVSPARRAAEAAAAEPEVLRTDLPTQETVVVRGLAACSVCEAAVAERCHDNDGTSAFVHEARVRAAFG